jgi:hypothetical protein
MKQRMRASALTMITATAAGGALALLNQSCGPVSAGSEPSFAHFSGTALMGTPLALLRYRQLSILQGGSTRICIENLSKSISNAEARLEVQLAFAAWLKASEASAAIWDEISFESVSKCARDGSNLAVIVLPDASGSNFDSREREKNFEQPTYSCELNGSSVSCRTNTMTLGWGGPAAVRYTQQSDGKLVQVQVSRAPQAVMSPRVDWQPLSRALASETPNAEGGGGQNQWQQTLARLSTNAKPKLQELTALVEGLAKAEKSARPDTVFKKALDDFAKSGKSSVTNVSYRPSLPFFSTLLHETGHIFGLDHADNPATDSVTGFANGEKVGDGQQAKTDLSVMAYAIPYLYLTADDQAGARSAAQAGRVVP